MNAKSVLERLEQLGIAVEVDGREVYVNPAHRVPDELWPELSRAKLDIFVSLMTDRIIRETPSSDALIDRLRLGYEWVCESAEFLTDDPSHVAGTDRLPRTMRWTRVWIHLDEHVRDAFDYTGCILAEGTCADVGGLRCGGCRNA